jgi:DNA-binding transcriptional ArsR family regulator
MSNATLHKTGERLQEAGIEAAWAQWSSLGASALQDRQQGHLEGRLEAPTSIVDPEALLLLSLYLEPSERRLRDFTRWWAKVGSDLLSVQRTKTLLKDFPPETENRLGIFAFRAKSAGDKRWARLASESPPSPERGQKGADDARLDEPSSLLLRLRAGFGVSAKADVLAYLIGIEERPVGRQDVAEATGYSRPTVRGALRDLTRAGFIREHTGRPIRYVAPIGRWNELLRLEAPSVSSENRPNGTPIWRHWAGVFSFLTSAADLARRAGEESDYVLSSKARDLFERHAPVFEENRIRVPDPTSYRGPEYLDGFVETARALAEWIPSHL